MLQNKQWVPISQEEMPKKKKEERAGKEWGRKGNTLREREVGHGISLCRARNIFISLA